MTKRRITLTITHTHTHTHHTSIFIDFIITCVSLEYAPRESTHTNTHE
jgi:hypothetical protein